MDCVIKDVDIMGGFRIKKRMTARPSAIESPSKVILSDSEKNSKFLKWCELQSAEVSKSDTLRHERGVRVVWEARFSQSPTSHTTRTHTLSCLRVSDFETSTLCNSHRFRNFDFFSESLKITFEGLSIALGLVVIFFLIHYVHVLLGVDFEFIT